MLYITTQFLLLTTIVLVVLSAGYLLFTKVGHNLLEQEHPVQYLLERAERFRLSTTVTVGARIGDWAFGIQDNVWEAVHTSDWKPGFLGRKWLYLVNVIEARTNMAAIRANERLVAMDVDFDWDDEGTFVEAD